MEQAKAPAVLTIEDDQAIGRLISLILTTAGFAVRQETTGAGGLAAVADLQPDVVLLDLTLPDVNGVELIPRVAACSQASVIVLTGAGSGRLLAESLAAGAYDVLLKPFDPDDLEEYVKTACGAPDVLEAQRRFAASVAAAVRDPSAAFSYTEFRLLRMLAERKGQPVLHQELGTRLWGRPLRDDIDLLQAWVHRLQAKVGVEEFHGVGYALEISPEAGGKPAL